MVGSALTVRLGQAGHEVVRLSRRSTERGSDGRATRVLWDAATGRFDAEAAAGCDAVVHLAGENVAGGRWTADRMERIEKSRTDGTRLLVEGLAGIGERPRIWVGASATGYYGDTGQTEASEATPRGDGFLAEVCERWEAASAAAEAWPARRVLLRIGIVLSGDGGALQKMLPFFRLGVGGPLGNGRQWMSWVSLDDLCGLFERALTDATMQGVFNAVSPTPVTNAQFTKALGRALHRPAVLPVPAFGLRLLYGRMADALLLGSQRAVPNRLLDAGHQFADTDLEATLRRVLG